MPGWNVSPSGEVTPSEKSPLTCSLNAAVLLVPGLAKPKILDQSQQWEI